MTESLTLRFDKIGISKLSHKRYNKIDIKYTEHSNCGEISKVLEVSVDQLLK